MKKVFARVLPLVLLLACLVSAASAGTISAKTLRYFNTATHNLSFQVEDYTLKSFDPWLHLGETFWFASNADSPLYTYAAERLTDGQADLLWISENGGGVGYMSYQFPGIDGTGRQDWQGYKINRIGLQVIGYFPLWDQFQFNEIVDYNPVPEPSTLLALAFGLSGLLLRRRK
jgi:hypothetical protein